MFLILITRFSLLIMYISGDVSLQCSYYNYKVNAWEPVLEPCAKTENIYRPWEISVKVIMAFKLDRSQKSSTCAYIIVFVGF